MAVGRVSGGWELKKIGIPIPIVALIGGNRYSVAFTNTDWQWASKVAIYDIFKPKLISFKPTKAALR